MSTETIAETITFEVQAWVGCLSCHNGGRPHGRWLEGTDAGDVIAAGLATDAVYAGTTSHYARCVTCGGDEWWVFDHSGYGKWLTGECSPHEAQRRAELIAEIEADHHDPFVVAAWADNQHEVEDFVWEDKRGDFEDAFVGTYESWRDFADAQADERMGAHSLDAKRPPSYDYEACARFDHIEWLTSFFDYERHSGELLICGDFDAFVVDGDTHVFRSA